MSSLVLLYGLYFLVYSTFLYFCDQNDIYDTQNTIKLKGACIKSFTTLLGGILASFVVPASYLFKLTIILFGIGTVLLELNKTWEYFAWLDYVSFAISFGLFKFLFITILLDQEGPMSTKLRIRIWFIVELFSYVVVYMLLFKNSINIKILTIILIIVAIATIFGEYFKLFTIDSQRLNIVKLIRFFFRKREMFETRDNESADALISISKATIISLLLVPYGICDNQEQYAYEYQYVGLKKPNLTDFFNKFGFWNYASYCPTIIAFSLLLITGILCKWKLFERIESSQGTQIIVGNILMIISTVICGFVETMRIRSICYQMGTCSVLHDDSGEGASSLDIVPTADITVFVMVPQIVLLAISEVLVIPTGIELLYKNSSGSTKYLSVAFFVSTVEIGGTSDLISWIMNIKKLFETTFSHDNLIHRADYMLYGLSALAFTSLILSICLMKRFGKFFKTRSHYEHLINQQT